MGRLKKESRVLRISSSKKEQGQGSNLENFTQSQRWLNAEIVAGPLFDKPAKRATPNGPVELGFSPFNPTGHNGAKIRVR